jgi:hypothetical protein
MSHMDDTRIPVSKLKATAETKDQATKPSKGWHSQE